MSIENVKKLYTNFPYPAYNADLDKNAPNSIECVSYILNTDEINHCIYKGKKRNFDNYKVLIAGVGIGTDFILMAKNLEYFKNTKVIGIDLSSTSLEICRKRTEKYNLSNIELVEMNLLNLNSEIYGLFDCIICIGVLHHLENPPEGLNVLKSVLKDDGHMQIMVYGKIGRMGVYHMQDLLKIINKETDDYKEKINNFKKIYTQLPSTNWLKKSEDFIGDHIKSDAGIVDLLLHCQDRAYTIDELYEFVEGCNLCISDFMYDIKHRLNFPLPTGINASQREKYKINELLFGDICRYSFYITKDTNKDTIADIDDLNNKLVINNHILNSLDIINTIIQHQTVPYPESITIKINCTSSYSRFEFMIASNDVIIHILKNINSKKTIKNIFNDVRGSLNYKLSDKEIMYIFKPVYKILSDFFILLLTK